MNQKQVNVISRTIGWLTGYLLVSSVMGWWFEWIFEVIAKKEIKYLLAFGFMMLVNIALPDKIKPYFLAAMVLATGYIWFFN